MFSKVFRLAPQVRLELTTLRLTAECSAIELLRIIAAGAYAPARLGSPSLRFATFAPLCSASLALLSAAVPGRPLGFPSRALLAGLAIRPFLPRSLPEREKLPFLPLPLLDPGDFLLSQAVPSSVPSAFGGLTSVFGMGTGGSLQPLSPETLMSPSRALASGLHARFRPRFRPPLPRDSQHTFKTAQGPS